jgi:hypothetical protein
MKVIVTCGPSHEPIDGARRMTNMSTGKLGVTLANVLADAGHEVICLKGEGSTFPGAVRAARTETFGTTIWRGNWKPSAARNPSTPSFTPPPCAIIVLNRC